MKIINTIIQIQEIMKINTVTIFTKKKKIIVINTTIVKDLIHIQIIIMIVSEFLLIFN